MAAVANHLTTMVKGAPSDEARATSRPQSGGAVGSRVQSNRYWDLTDPPRSIRSEYGAGADVLSRRQVLLAAVAGGAAVLLPQDNPGRVTTTSQTGGLDRQAQQRRDPGTRDHDSRQLSGSMQRLPTSDALFAHLVSSTRRLTATEADDLGPIGSRGRALAWNWSFWGRALVFAYRATGEARFLDLFVATFARMLDHRDDRLGLRDAPKRRVIAGWGTDVGGLHVNEITVAGLVTLPICEFLLLMRENPDAMRRYGNVGKEYLTVAEDVAWQFETDYRLTRFGGQYVHPVTGVSEPLNHNHALGAAFAHLSVLTNKQRYRAKVDEIAQFFRASVTREENGSWSWPYVSSPHAAPARPAETIWKAGTTIEFPVAALRHGLAFGNDFPALSMTLTKNILRPDGINQFVTSRRTSLLGGGFAGLSPAGAGLALWFLMPDPEGTHRAALLRHMDRQPELFPDGWLGGARALVMAAAWLMNG
jgi:hypothetical protein